MKRTLACVALLLVCASVNAQTAFAPQPILQGGQVIPLFPPNSPFLKADRVGEAEVLNMMKGVPGRIQSIVNIHNPSIEVHVVDPGINTGTVVILAPGGGHDTLNVGTEGADFVSFFYQYGVHIYGNGVHANGLKDRDDTPFGTWQFRYIDWFRDLGFLGKPGVETKAAKDVATRAAQPQRGQSGAR